MTKAWIWLLAAVFAYGGAAPATAGTGKAPVEGALSASNDRPTADGEPVWIYFSATPLEDRAQVTLEITLPYGMRELDGETLRRTFQNVSARTTLQLVVAATVADDKQKDILATAIMNEGAGSVARRAFLLQLNATPAIVNQGRPGTSADGKGLIIFDSAP